MNASTATEVLRDRLRAVRAHGRVAESVLAVALDLVEPFASEYLPPDDYRDVSELLRGPAEAATDTALATLISELLQVAAAGDPKIASRVRASIERRGTRWTPYV
jgi:hypothetical protein